MKKSAIIFLGVAATSLVICGICLLLYSNSSGVLYEKGLKALLTGRYDDAQEYMQRVVDKNDARRGDAYYALAQCCAHQGDSVASYEYLHKAALDMNSDAAREYLVYLDGQPALGHEYVDFLTYMHEHSPEECLYAWRLAWVKLDSMDYEAAGELLQPYVSFAGTALPGTPVEAKVLAAEMMCRGQGGYALSPEGAITLANSCQSALEERDWSEINGWIFFRLGHLKLIELAYIPESDIIRNIGLAKRYFDAFTMRTGYTFGGIEMLDEYLNEASQVVINPLWWERRPQDWKSYSNDSGFRYIGHTVGSGNKNYHDGMPDRPQGMGCGVDNRSHLVYIGKWGGSPSSLQKGVRVQHDGLVTIGWEP